MRPSTIVTVASFFVAALAAPLNTVPAEGVPSGHVERAEPKLLARDSHLPWVHTDTWIPTLNELDQRQNEFPKKAQQLKDKFWGEFSLDVNYNWPDINARLPARYPRPPQPVNPEDATTEPQTQYLSDLIEANLESAFPDEGLSNMQYDINDMNALLASGGSGAAGGTPPPAGRKHRQQS